MLRYFVLLCATIGLQGCFVPIGEIDKSTGFVGSEFSLFVETGDALPRHGNFTCQWGRARVMINMVEEVKGSAFDPDVTYLLTPIGEPVFAQKRRDVEARAASTGLSAKVKQRAMAAAESSAKVMRLRFAKRIGSPYLAEFQGEGNSRSYLYFEFAGDGTFSVLTSDYENKKAATERLATPEIKFEPFAGFLGLYGPHADVRRLIDEATYEHLKELATCSFD